MSIPSAYLMAQWINVYKITEKRVWQCVRAQGWANNLRQTLARRGVASSCARAKLIPFLKSVNI